MVQSLSPWLVKFVTKEIADVLEWHKIQDPKVKPDPDSRFENDGSNFRSTSADLPAACSLQLIEVVQVDTRPHVTVSDGQVRMKARLSADARTALEDEIGGKLSVDTTNDIFKPKNVTVFSTPFGPTTGMIQIHINDLAYEHHLRRSEGYPLPIDEVGGIQKLIAEITRIRTAEIMGNKDTDDGSTKDRMPTSPRLSPTPNEDKGASPSKVKEILRTLSSPPKDLPRSQPKPSLAADGFEVETGVNLQHPVKAVSKDPRSTSVGNGTNKLFGLLAGEQKLEKPKPACKPVSQTRRPGFPNLKYARKPIPADQMALLNQDDAWNPPSGNVPQAVRKKWDAARRANGSERSAPIEISDNEEFTASQWPSSPPPAPELPPDSSFDTIVHETKDERAQAPKTRLKRTEVSNAQRKAIKHEERKEHTKRKRQAGEVSSGN